MKLDERGAGALFIVVILLILGGAGYYLYQNSTKEATVNSFQECADVGYPVQESYPEVCVTKDGRRFPNPEQTVQ